MEAGISPYRRSDADHDCVQARMALSFHDGTLRTAGSAVAGVGWSERGW
jgi:hypothetical protein